MSDTPTPETDANDEAWQYNMQYDTFSALMDDPIPWAEFARKLERKLNEAREQLAEWSILTAWGGTPEIIHEFIKGQQSRINHAQDVEEELATAIAERDEAREQLAEIEQKVSLQLGGHPNSKLWGGSGLIAATMRCVDALDEVTEQRDKWKSKYIQQNKNLGCEMMGPNGTIWDHAKTLQNDLNEAREQRDRLAEAFEKVSTFGTVLKLPVKPCDLCARTLNQPTKITDALEDTDESNNLV